MQQSYGFSLIEFLIYCSLSSFMAVLIMQIIVSFEQKILQQQKNAQTTATMMASLDSFSRICRQAPACAKNWHALGPVNIAWSHNAGTSEFSFDKQRLLYITRNKDSTGAVHSSYNVLLSGVQGSFSVDKEHDRITCVHLLLSITTPSRIMNVSKNVVLAQGQLI